MKRLVCLLPLLLAACLPVTGAPQGDVEVSRKPTQQQGYLLAPSAAPPSSRSSVAVAQDFLDLAFRLESGRSLPVFTRYDGPITVALAGAVPPSAPADLAQLVARLRNEAAIDIREVASGPASITVEFLPRHAFKGHQANIACFVVPRVSSWAEYRRLRGNAALDWVTLARRERAAAFIPSDASPQEVRDCLHEEISQAIGPLNDLYRLPDSIFNDDNFHAVLTGFDMLILRLHYAPELHSGMTEAEVAAALPAIVSRMNPGGGSLGHDGGATPAAWVAAMESALGAAGTPQSRRAAAERALTLARGYRWHDARLGFSHFALGRLHVPADPARATFHLSEAARIYRALPGSAIHLAHVDMQRAALALAQGDTALVLDLTDHALPVARGAENPALAATLMLLRAEALDLTGRAAEAQRLRLDSRGLARYGFGSDAAIAARRRDISALIPARRASDENG